MAAAPRQLLEQIALRKRLVHLGRRGHLFTLIFALVFGTVLIVLRVLNVIENPFKWWMVFLVPLAGLLVAGFFHHRITEIQAARMADEHAQTKDLFLTASTLSTAAGGYQDAVREEAVRKAPTVLPKEVVPFHPMNKLTQVAVALLVLGAGVLWLPGFDLLNKEAARQKTVDRKQRLEQTQKTIVKRSKRLKKQALKEAQSKQVQARIKALQQALRRMNPRDAKGNLKKLADQKQRVQEAWQQKKLAQSLKNNPAQQRFGSTTDQQRQWQKQMQKGQSQALNQKMQEVKKKAQQLAQTTDPQERKKLQKEIKQSLGEMADYAQKQQGGQKLAQSLKQALEQLDMTQMKDVSKEAAKTLSQTMELSQQELEQLAQNVRDIKKLEQAMKTIQQAQQANNKKPLDGKAAAQCNSMADYQKLYKQMMQQQASGQGSQPGSSQSPGKGNSQGQGQMAGSGKGGGMKGQGRGRGNIASEDDSIATHFQTEKEKTKLNAGKILLRWKTKGIAPSGQAVKDYQQSLNTIKQDASQALDSEQVPAGYHEAIKKYFDTIEQANDAQTKPIPSQ